MAEIVTARDIYENYGEGDDEGFEDVCYVRESDYAALLERHRRLVDAYRIMKTAWYDQRLPNEWYGDVTKDYDEKYSHLTVGQVAHELSKAALAEEVE